MARLAKKRDMIDREEKRREERAQERAIQARQSRLNVRANNTARTQKEGETKRMVTETGENAGMREERKNTA